MHCLMYQKFLDFNVRIASAVWFTLFTWIPSTFSFVQVILFRVGNRGRTLNLSETKLWMSDTELNMSSLRLIGFITVIIHRSVEEQLIFWRHARSACVTSCWKNVIVHTNFISTVLFLGIENWCRCAAVGLWYGNWHFLPFLCFSFFINPFVFIFFCVYLLFRSFISSLFLFMSSFLISTFFVFFLCHLFLPYSLLSFSLSFFSGLPRSSVWVIKRRSECPNIYP
jgi:hypothetical protein